MILGGTKMLEGDWGVDAGGDWGDDSGGHKDAGGIGGVMLEGIGVGDGGGTKMLGGVADSEGH